MKGKIRYGNSVIQYSVIKSRRRKTSEIIVDGKSVVIRAPKDKPMSEIQKIVKRKGQWIFKKQLEFRNRPVQISRTKYTQKFLRTRVAFYSAKVGVVPRKVTVKKLQSRWGSATKNNEINLNTSLLKAPKDVIDYVVLHELCHLKIRSHSRAFWNLLNKFMPRYQEQKKWLEQNGQRIS